MKAKCLHLLAAVALLVALLPPAPAAAEGGDALNLPIPVDISHRLKNLPAPPQLSPEEVTVLLSTQATTTSQCLGSGDSITISIPSFDPANPGSQDVVFWSETPAAATGKARLWVAWDFLTTHYGRTDVITCDQLAYLQGQMDSIVATNVEYFGNYVQRPTDNDTIDVMIYNIVDESYFDATFPFYIAGFFWSNINEFFDRNMIFIDSYDWANRLGPDVARPYLYEGTVAHELEHLIHNDHDADELSWVDEGLADLAEFLNGFGHPDGHVVYYLAFHRTSLTNWGGGLEDYGASYLFQLYLLEQFGAKTGDVWNPTWTLGLVDQPLNGIAGIEAATGKSMNDLYDAWVLANYLDNPTLSGPDGLPLGYDEIGLTPFVSGSFTPWSIARGITDTYGSDHQGNLPVSRYYGGYKSGTVEYPLGALPPYAPLYGTYKGIQPLMSLYVRGDAHSGIAPNDGTYQVASGMGNMLSDRMLLLNVPVGGTLTFWTWYDIEEEWDYGFVEVSTDGGATWAPLAGSITRASNNPNDSTAWANSLMGGQGSTDTAITGSSEVWVEATFTLPAASGVLVRFAYYTDEAVNGAGWFIDDVAVNGFSDGFETDPINWTLGGWAWTTGLFANDWMTAYVNPMYNRGKLDVVDYAYLDGAPVQSFEVFQGVLDTSRLLKDQATIVFSNRPGESPFDAGYLILVQKGNASKK